MAITASEPLKATAKPAFNEMTLPAAVGSLFTMNNYDVEYDIHVNGAQVDLVARSRSDPFASPVYIEVTVEYVNNNKYAKDSTKFLLIRELHPDAQLVCLSSSGFTADVKERATKSRVQALTYEELFAKFERFSPYVNHVLNDDDLALLSDAYEEPQFNDRKGVDGVSAWLKRWKAFASEEAKWLIVLGEYGTGKTALTKVLQYRWLREYHANPSLPIPIRIELRNFSKQFDARGLLHHFLDTNRLPHVSIDFLTFLIKTGRVVLLLDGYDEMAQFLTVKERRACLGALAELSSDGAKGILTSRPNYFTETEELNVFEALYVAIEQSRIHLSKSEKAFIESEVALDNLVERYVLDKYERSLQDLTPEQTRSLVRRKLSKSVTQQNLVISMLDRVFREELSGTRQALSGKPVIISYLLEIVEDLSPAESDLKLGELTEWEVYRLVVDRLMIRDMQRTSMNPIVRRRVLQSLALMISGRDKLVADEATFQSLINEQFGKELRLMSGEEAHARRTQLFEDLRSSATLTRAEGIKGDGWTFSHNSLREYLVAEALVKSLRDRSPTQVDVPVTDAMRAFTASISQSDAEDIWTALSEGWAQRVTEHELGPYITLLWDLARKSDGGAISLMRRISGSGKAGILDLNALTLKGIDFSADLADDRSAINFSGSVVSECSFHNADLAGSSFVSSILDSASFRQASLRDCLFDSALLFEVDLVGAEVKGASFIKLDNDSSIFVEDGAGHLVSLSGQSALGYLNWHGGLTDSVDDYYIYRHHPRFSIIEKILDKISSQRNSQLRGLTQRGEAQVDPPFAREFMDLLKSLGWVNVDKNDLVSVTSSGRPEVQRMVQGHHIAQPIVQFLSARSV